MRPLLAIFAILTALSAHAQFRSTLCQTGDEHIARSLTPVQRLFGCGEGFPENVLWHLDRADSRSGALDTRTYVPATGEGVVVYVVDMSIREEHVEFARAEGSIVIAEKFVGGVPAGGCPGSGSCSAFSSHGTGVASILGGATLGIAPGVRIVSIIAGPSHYREALRAIVDHAYSATAPQFRTAVVNISGGFGPGVDVDALGEDVRKMTSGVDANMNPNPNGKRFVFAVAAGNAAAPGESVSGCAADGTVISFPGIFGPEIGGLITVGAITRANQVWDRSCGGPAVEVLAPGAEVLLASATADDHYLVETNYGSGTSFATPYVAGMAARVLEREPDLSPAEVEARLKDSPSHVAGLPVPVMAPALKRRAVR